jgi:hypothetical protein
MKTIFGFIFIILNEIIKFFRIRPIVFLLLIFGLWVNSLPLPDETIVIARPDPQVERIFANPKALGISGDDGFRNPAPSTRDLGTTGAGDRGQDRLIDYDPSPKIPVAGNPAGSSVSFGALIPLIPNQEDLNIDEWLEEGGDECNDFEEAIESDSLPVKVNFAYIRDANGNPTLLVPNMDSTRTMPGRTFNRVEYDQTLSHLQHLPEFGIQLPTSFDMGIYKNLPTKADKIQYGKNISHQRQ